MIKNKVGRWAVENWQGSVSTCLLHHCRPYFVVLFLALLPSLSFAQQDSLNVADKKVEVLTEYPGGVPGLIRFLTENLQYPRKARRKSIEGIVLASFIIDEQGKVTQPKIKKGLGGGCNEEVLRLLAFMQPWRPPTQNGKPVRVQYDLPIRFNLEPK